MAADPAPRGASRYAFGPFAIDVRTRIVTRDGVDLPLPPKAVDTLLVLVERAGEIVSRDE